jgi:hypothetical protein
MDSCLPLVINQSESEMLNSRGKKYYFACVTDDLFDSYYDKCYCKECHASRFEMLYHSHGKPAKDYSIPMGWCRFALK